MKTLIGMLVCASLLAGCATVPGPEQMKSKWQGGDEATFNKVYSECRLRADDDGPGAGTFIASVIFWPLGAYYGVAAMNAENKMKLCMAANGWSPK